MISTIMKYDFPKLKERGFKYAIILEGRNGEYALSMGITLEVDQLNTLCRT